MAIAFSLPSDECTLEHYRRIQQLLLDLINLIRTLINSDTPLIPSPSPISSSVPASGSHFGFPTPPSSVPNSPSPFSPNATSSTPAFVLPDVITSAATLEELRNLLISRNSSSVGPSAAPAAAAPTVGSVPPSVLRPTQEIRNDTQRIPAAEPQNRSAPSNPKLRKRKRARVSRKKKCCFECVRENDPEAMEVTPSPSSPQAASIAGHNGERKATTLYKCSCNETSNFEISFPNTHSHRDHQHHHHHHTRHHVPSADSEFYKMDSAYYRRIAAAAAAATNSTTADCKSQYWMNVGEELFRNPSKKDEKLCDENENRGLNGIISNCGRTVFAAALLVLGWKLLK